MTKGMTYSTLHKKINSELKTARTRLAAARQRIAAVLRRDGSATAVALCQELPALIVLQVQVQTWERLAQPLQAGELTAAEQMRSLRAVAVAMRRLRTEAAFDLMGDSVSTSQFHNVAQATALRATLQIVSEDGWLWVELEKWRLFC